MLEYLSENEIVNINRKLGYRPLNKALVGSVLSAWQYYDSLEDQISSVIGGIIKNHAFEDGNKRTAVIVYYNLCSIFNLKSLNEDAMFDAVIEIASSKKSITEISKMLFR